MTTTPLPPPTAWITVVETSQGPSRQVNWQKMRGIEHRPLFLETQMIAYATQARADLEAENTKLHKLLAWIIDECHVYPEGAEAKAFANRLVAAITHPKAGAHAAKAP